MTETATFPDDKAPKDLPSTPKVAATSKDSDETPKIENISKRRGRPRKDVATKKIEDGLAELLCFPALICAGFGDEWAVNHFTTNGRTFAHNIAKASENNERLRAMCESMLKGETITVLLVSGVMYALPPLIYWGIVPVNNPLLRGMMSIPDKTEDEPTLVNDNDATDNPTNGKTQKQRRTSNTAN